MLKFISPLFIFFLLALHLQADNTFFPLPLTPKPTPPISYSFVPSYNSPPPITYIPRQQQEPLQIYYTYPQTIQQYYPTIPGVNCLPGRQ